MIKLVLSKTSEFKLLSNIIAYANFSDASIIHIEKSVNESVTVKYGSFGNFSTPLSLTNKQGAELWSSILQNSHLSPDYRHDNITVLLNQQELHCQLDYLSNSDKQIIIIKLEPLLAHTKTWDDFGLANTLGDDLLDTITNLNGLVIIAGTSNTQKSALAYALLNEINHKGLVVHSLESPIVQNQSNIIQSEWQLGQGYSYQTGFEAICRQDTDVIYLDNDKFIDWNRLSTIAKSRLIILRSSTEDLSQLFQELLVHDTNHRSLDLIKLVFLIKDARQNCPHCSHSTDLTNQEIVTLSKITGLDIADISSMRFQIADGCLHCQWRGYQETLSLFDLLIPDANIINSLRIQSPDSHNTNYLHEAFYINSLEDAWLKANQGLISHREIIRLFS